MQMKRSNVALLLLLLCGLPHACTNSKDHLQAGHTWLPDTLLRTNAAVTLRTSDSAFIAEPSALMILDSAIVVADAGSSSLLQFRRDGEFVSRIGRRGRGPSEFTAPAAIVNMADTTIAVVDAGLQRLSILDRAFRVRTTRPIPGLAMSAVFDKGGFVVGVQDPASKTSAAFLPAQDSSVVRLGRFPQSLLDNPQIAASYPFSVVTKTETGVIVGFTGADWIYRLGEDGLPTDSMQPVRRVRRGVPSDLGRRLEKSRSPDTEAAATSLLIGLWPLSKGRVAIIHMDFIVDGPSVTGAAFYSSLDSELRSLCTDIVVPLEKDTRPMFSTRGDTLFVVQNRIVGEAASTRVAAYALPDCTTR